MDIVNAIPFRQNRPGTIAPSLAIRFQSCGVQTHAMMAFALAALVAYASLFPFNFESRSLGEAFDRLQRGFARQPIEVGDFVGNILMMVPLGYFLLGTLRVDRRGGSVRATASALGIAAVLSVMVEFLQAFFPPRTPCLNDIFGQFLGACVGVGVWQCCGRDLTARARHIAATGDLRVHANLLLGLYAAGLVLVTLLPFQLVLRPEMWGVRATWAVMRAFEGGVAPAGADVYLWSLLLLLPAGMLAAFATRDGDRAFQQGAIVVLALAAAELTVHARRFDLFNVGIEAAAFGLGWLQGRTMSRTRGSTTIAGGAFAVVLGMAWLAAATSLIHGQELDFTDNPDLLLDRMAMMNWWPLNDIYHDNYLRVLRTALQQGALFLVGGGILALGARDLLGKNGTAPAAAVALATALLLEVGQLSRPGLQPSVTAILWQATGAWLGFALVRGLMSPRAMPSPRPALVPRGVPAPVGSFQPS